MNDQLKEIKQLKKISKELNQSAESMKVNSLKDLEVTKSFIIQAILVIRRVEKIRLEMLKPLRQQIREINTYTRELTDSMTKTKNILRNKAREATKKPLNYE